MECNIYPQYITSEIFGLPMIQKTVSVIVEPKKTLINNGLNKAHVLENENIRDLSLYNITIHVIIFIISIKLWVSF